MTQFWLLGMRLFSENPKDTKILIFVCKTNVWKIGCFYPFYYKVQFLFRNFWPISKTGHFWCMKPLKKLGNMTFAIVYVQRFEKSIDLLQIRNQVDNFSDQVKILDFFAKWCSCPHVTNCDVLGSSNKSLMCKLLKYRLKMTIF